MRNFIICTVHLIWSWLLPRRLRWVGHIIRNKEGRSAFKILTGKPTGKRPSRNPRHRWEDKIRMGLKELGINTVDWVDSAQDRNY